jgi:hypothetical protein
VHKRAPAQRRQIAGRAGPEQNAALEIERRS